MGGQKTGCFGAERAGEQTIWASAPAQCETRSRPGDLLAIDPRLPASSSLLLTQTVYPKKADLECT